MQMREGADESAGGGGRRQEDSGDSAVKAATNGPLALALLVAVLVAATYQLLDKLTVKKYGAATTKVRRPAASRMGSRALAPIEPAGANLRGERRRPAEGGEKGGE